LRRRPGGTSSKLGLARGDSDIVAEFTPIAGFRQRFPRPPLRRCCYPPRRKTACRD
jgi:hypothetical protein